MQCSKQKKPNLTCAESLHRCHIRYHRTIEAEKAFGASFPAMQKHKTGSPLIL